MQCARQSMAGARRRPPGCLQSISRILPLAALAALAAGEVQARPYVRVTMKSALGYAADGFSMCSELDSLEASPTRKNKRSI
jgi:hypothetical protein